MPELTRDALASLIARHMFDTNGHCTGQSIARAILAEHAVIPITYRDTGILTSTHGPVTTYELADHDSLTAYGCVAARLFHDGPIIITPGWAWRLGDDPIAHAAAIILAARARAAGGAS